MAIKKEEGMMAIMDGEPLNPKDFVVINGKKIHKNEIRRALRIAKLVEELHCEMGHSYIDPPVY